MNIIELPGFEIKPVSTLFPINLPSLPDDAQVIIKFFEQYTQESDNLDRSNVMIFDGIRCTGDLVLSGNLEILNFCERNRIGAIYCRGDMVIDGNLIDATYNTIPCLFVTGDLYVKHWLRSGIFSFINGDVKSDGNLVGNYNDTALFVGGNLIAESDIYYVKDYEEFPGIKLHQIRGKSFAKTLDLVDIYWGDDITNIERAELFGKYFVEELIPHDLTEDDGGYVDFEKLFYRAVNNKPIWK